MSRYQRVPVAIHRIARSRGLTDDAHLALLYVLTCSHRTSEGLFLLPRAYASADLGWSVERFAEAFGELLAQAFVEYDDVAEVCLILDALQWQPPANDNVAKAAIKAIRDLPLTPLLARLYELSERLSKRLAKHLAEEFPEQFAERLGEPQALSPALPPSPAPSPSPADAEPERADVDHLLDFHLECVQEHDPKFRPARPEVERQAARRLIDEDGRTVDEFELVCRWAQAAHPDQANPTFWRSRTLSVVALRKSFGTLWSQANSSPSVVHLAEKREMAARAEIAVQALAAPSDAHRADWDRLRTEIERSTSDTAAWPLYAESFDLVGVSDGALVIDGPEASWSWQRAQSCIARCAERIDVRARLASEDEHTGLQAVAA